MDARAFHRYAPTVKIKFVVGEIRELDSYPINRRSKNGFHTFISTIAMRVEPDTGEIWLDDEDFRNINRYKRSGYKKRLRAIFQRTLGPDLDGSPVV